MKLDVFAFESYKEFLKEYVKLHQRRGVVGDLAVAAGCDRSYLSQSLGSKVQLTPDHILGLSEYFKFSPMEEDYFLLLLLRERASTPKSKMQLKKKMERLKSDNQNLAKKFRARENIGELRDDQKSLYYSTWHYPAIHILTSSRAHQTVDEIANRLQMPKRRVTDVLQELIQMELVKVEEGRYVHSGGNIHIPKDSPFHVLNHIHWRTKAMDYTGSDDSIHYSHVFAISKKDWHKLKETLIHFLEEQRRTIHSSGSEDVYAFCCDLFCL